MGKKYKYTDEKPEERMVREPAIAYGKEQTITPPCQYSVEKLREKFDRAVTQAETGEVLSHEEVKKRYKKL